ncbi:hypothetical protein CAPTEDRAFT_157320 [Capitella teleta]|uniref:Eukaryotic translation initiation factor 2A n=1 Tax=Capitella teleta TaxID=283909 RepID=R7TV69_CAPTE|nr:hypothetical protein CAPTEDRAFT_157320 [Capitella teleta]|eukprot:ELT97619.1 hypothetical protein CAPTEDRAFT_157320 [Capitella teleta]
MVNGPPAAISDASDFPRIDSQRCRVMTFSEDGSHLAFCDGQSTKVLNTQTNRLVFEADRPRTASLHLSPKSGYLATWEPYMVSKDQPAGTPNMYIYDIKSGKALHSFIQKKGQGWNPQWSKDETVSARMANTEVHFYEGDNFVRTSKKLNVQKLADFKLAPSPNPPHKVAVYILGSKGQPCFVRLFQYPNFGGNETALASKSFFKADKCDIFWNNKGSAVLVLTVAEAATSDSYYGEQGLHFLDVKGDSCFVPRAKSGPIYSVEWNPNSTDFCVVYGSMPAKATLYSLKCEPIFDFGTGPRNCVYYNPFGNMLTLTGFGNLHGNVEMWHLAGAQNTRLISQFKVPDTTHFEWSPDGTHVLTATTTPRLRVGNGYKVYHYTGQLLSEFHTTGNEELWEARWKCADKSGFPVPLIETSKNSPTAIKPVMEEKPKKYVPPAMRKQAGGGSAAIPAKTSVFKKEYELPSNLKQQDQEAETVSKSKKKREAKKRGKQFAEEGGQPRTEGADQGEVTSADREKKIRNVKKKLQGISKLKQELASGKQLDSNQMQKLKAEEALVEELKQLRL